VSKIVQRGPSENAREKRGALLGAKRLTGGKSAAKSTLSNRHDLEASCAEIVEVQGDLMLGGERQLTEVD
jgi:hypothetical protein